LFVVTADEGPVTGSVGGIAVDQPIPTVPAIYIVELEAVPAGDIRLSLATPGGVAAAWLVPLADEIPPPPPQAWSPPPANEDEADGGL
jgi:hypothetical protein